MANEPRISNRRAAAKLESFGKTLRSEKLKLGYKTHKQKVCSKYVSYEQDVTKGKKNLLEIVTWKGYRYG